MKLSKSLIPLCLVKKINCYNYEDGYLITIPEGGVMKKTAYNFFLRDPLRINSTAIESTILELSSGGLEVR